MEDILISIVFYTGYPKEPSIPEVEDLTEVRNYAAGVFFFSMPRL